MFHILSWWRHQFAIILFCSGRRANKGQGIANQQQPRGAHVTGGIGEDCTTPHPTEQFAILLFVLYSEAVQIGSFLVIIEYISLFSLMLYWNSYQ